MDIIAAVVPILLIVLVISFMVRSLNLQKRIADAVEELVKRGLPVSGDAVAEAERQQKAKVVTKIPGIN